MRLTALIASAVLTAGVAAAQAPPEALPPGNDAAGAIIVGGKGKCQACHRIQNTGSRLGPDLTDIGALRNTEQLLASLVDPGAEILPENRFYRVVTREGVTVTGRLLNLDTFQVLMRDPKDQLRSFDKAALREHGFVKGSSMPSYRTTLSPQELADVIAYLSTLKGVASQ